MINSARSIDHPIYISSDAQLLDGCQSWSKAGLLAIDTEFIRTDTFYPIAGLIQLADESGFYLIDPLTINDFSPFADLMADQQVIKVLHSCGEDLDVFDRLLGVLPSPLLDTQIGAALAGIGFSYGYQRIVDELLGIHIAKGETRSDWLQRPLSESQLHYAVLDVAHLHEVFRILHERLADTGRIDWWYQEGERLKQRYRQNNDIDSYYQRVKSAWKLSAEQLSILRSLTVWREQEARRRNIPRGRVLKDKACLDISMRMPQSPGHLVGIDEVSQGFVRKHGEMVLELIRQGLDAEEFPPCLEKPLPPAANTQLKQLKSVASRCAQRRGVCEEILLTKKDFELLLRRHRQGLDQWPESLAGWREELLADDLQKVLRE